MQLPKFFGILLKKIYERDTQPAKNRNAGLSK